MYRFASSDEVDPEGLRARLQNMSDEKLLEFGNAAKYMCSPKANMGKPPREPFLIQLAEARAEWRKRHPRGEDTVLNTK